MTQAQLAEKAEVTVGYISRLESAGGGAVGLDLLARLAAALGATVAELVPEASTPAEPDAVIKAQVRELADPLAKTADRDTLPSRGSTPRQVESSRPVIASATAAGLAPRNLLRDNGTVFIKTG